MEFMEQVIIATKQQIIEGANINLNSKVISKCVNHNELEVMEISNKGSRKYRYYILSDFKL